MYHHDLDSRRTRAIVTGGRQRGDRDRSTRSTPRWTRRGPATPVRRAVRRSGRGDRLGPEEERRARPLSVHRAGVAALTAVDSRWPEHRGERPVGEQECPISTRIRFTEGKARVADHEIGTRISIQSPPPDGRRIVFASGRAPGWSGGSRQPVRARPRQHRGSRRSRLGCGRTRRPGGEGEGGSTSPPMGQHPQRVLGGYAGRGSPGDLRRQRGVRWGAVA